MKILRTVPFLFAPIFAQAALNSSLDANPPKALSSEEPKKDNLFTNVGNIFKLSALTPAENKALDELEDFLTKYTGNGKLNHGTINRLIEGLKHDYETINEEAQKIRGIKGMIGRKVARRYPNNIFQRNRFRIENEIVNKAYSEFFEKLSLNGTDPDTANNPDNSPIDNFVTKPVLEKLESNKSVLEEMEKRYLPPNKKIIFRDGISIEAIRFIRSRSFGLPPGAKLVDR